MNPTNLVDLLQQHGSERPDAAAVITPQGTLSRAQLDALIWSSADRLHAAGIRAGDRIGLTLLHPLAHLATSLGLARIGAAQVALPVADGQQTAATIAQTLSLKAVLHDSPGVGDEWSRWSADNQMELICLEQFAVHPVSDRRREEIACRDASRIWLFLQSSGTTGNPKFAELSHAGALARFERYRPLFDATPNDIFWPVSRLDFVVAKQRTMHALMAGAAVCLPVGLTISPALVDFVRRVGVTMSCGTPSHLHQLIAVGEPMPSLRVFEVRSAVIDEKLRKAFKKTVSPNLYVTYATNEGEALTLADPALQARIPDTVGRPTASIELQIVDDHGQSLPTGQTGEVRVRGPGVVTAYVSNPEASARSFRDGWFHPGDLAYLTPEGALMLQGRKDDMMIYDGMNVYPAEIENALLSHPTVREAAAFPLKHERFQDVPFAAVTLHDGASGAKTDESAKTAAGQALIEHCRRLIGIRHPRGVLVLDEFPRNPMGKILKRELAIRAARAVNG